MKSLKGHLLLASTALVDPNFAKSVVLLFEHSEDGAAGIILNRPSPVSIAHIAHKVFQFPSVWEKPINIGGPVSGPLAAAHTKREFADLEVMPGIYGALQPDHIRQLIQKQQEPTFFVLNYSGWGPGQLEQELQEDSWLVMPARQEHVFWSREEPLWENCVVEQKSVTSLQRSLGIKNPPRDPTLN
ncbi:MAG TPA: YqgE/AlgH family protein [Gemmatales bacterium]|nr:YqgE/AlgH family protein [Gemmatales bacterium]HMP17044.1 YqgE/AlgH family protein [Gemmatales bacterium]